MCFLWDDDDDFECPCFFDDEVDDEGEAVGILAAAALRPCSEEPVLDELLLLCFSLASIC